jgi:hypothetical protein
MFFSGVFISLFSLKFHHAAGRRRRGTMGKYESMAWGIPACGLLSLMFIRTGYIEAVISAIYSLYLWMLAFGMHGAGIRYDVYREQFTNWLRILLGIVAVSAIQGDPGAIETAGRYSIIFVISGPLLLRNSRELNLAKPGGGRKARIINIAANMAVVLPLMLVSSDGFIACLVSISGFIFNLINRALGYGVYIIAYPIGMLLSLVMYRFKLKADFNDIIIKPADPGEVPPVMESGPFIPHNIETGLKIVLLIIIAAVVIRIYNKHPKKKSTDDYTESREFVLNTRQLRDEIKKNFTSIASRFRRKGRVKPVTLKEKIRYLYYSFLELDIKHGIYKNKSQTSREIGRETMDYLKDNAVLE